MSHPDSPATPSQEERILRSMRLVLTGIIKDTATPPGMRHPLRDQTIEDMRQCLMLISARERELAAEAGRPYAMRPYYADEPQRRDRAPDEVVVPISSVGRRRQDED